MGAIHEIMGRPAVSVAWMVEEGIITLANCKLMVHRRDLEQASRGSRNHPALVFVDNMPLRFRGQVIEKLGDIYEAMETTILDIQHDAAAAQFFGDYITEGNRLLPADKRREYYGTACVLNAISIFIETGIGKSKVRGYRHRTPWETIMAALPHVDQDAFPFKLPDNQRSLERKWQRYKEEGYESLVHKNFKTKGSNAAKLLDDDQQNALLELLAMPQNWGLAKVTRLYNSVAKKQGWKEVTVSTVSEFAKKHTPDIRAARLGRSALRNTVSMQVKRTRPTTPLLFWTLDGWTAELFYRDENSDYNRLTLEVVLDTYNNYPVGYAIADRETGKLISAAMRNAELHIKELFGSMYRVNQVQADNYARTAMEPIYNYTAAMKSIVNGLRSVNPNMVVVFVTPPVRWVNYNASDPDTTGFSDYAANANSGLWLTDVAKHMAEVAAKCKAIAINAYDGLGVNEVNFSTFFTTGGVHPNEAGQKRIARIIAENMNTRLLGGTPTDHHHTNKEVLDAITASAWAGKVGSTTLTGLEAMEDSAYGNLSNVSATTLYITY